MNPGSFHETRVVYRLEVKRPTAEYWRPVYEYHDLDEVRQTWKDMVGLNPDEDRDPVWSKYLIRIVGESTETTKTVTVNLVDTSVDK